MARSSKKKKTHSSPDPRMITVLKNELTKAEMDEMEEEFVNHQGPDLTIAQVLVIEEAKQRGESPESPPSTDEG